MEEILSCKVMTETVLKDNLEPSDIQPETVLLEGVRATGEMCKRTRKYLQGKRKEKRRKKGQEIRKSEKCKKLLTLNN